jgi:hypothetical protein
MWKVNHAYNISVENRKKRDHLEDHCVGGSIILKKTFNQDCEGV